MCVYVCAGVCVCACVCNEKSVAYDIIQVLYNYNWVSFRENEKWLYNYIKSYTNASRLNR